MLDETPHSIEHVYSECLEMLQNGTMKKIDRWIDRYMWLVMTQNDPSQVDRGIVLLLGVIAFAHDLEIMITVGIATRLQKRETIELITTSICKNSILL
jgi:hypothetical protein